MLYTYEEIMALTPKELAENWTQVAQSSLELLGYDTVLTDEGEDTEDPEK